MTSNTQVITPREIAGVMEYHWSANTPVLFMGPSGCGKSATVEQFARAKGKELGYPHFWKYGEALPADPANTFALLDLRLASMDAADLKGFGSLDIVNGKTVFLTPEMLPDINVHGAAGYVFADEIDKADDGAVDAWSQIMLTGAIGTYVLPDTYRIASAANRKQDGTGGGKVKSHIVNRGGTYEVEPSVADWSAFDLSQGGSPVVHAFMRSVGAAYIYARDKADVAFASARSWSNASRVVQTVEDPDLARKLVAGFVGKAASDTLAGFQSLVASGAEIPSFAAVIADPMTAPIPSESNEHKNALAYAAIGIIANNVKTGNFTHEHMEAVLAYGGRLDKEHCTTLMFDLRVRDNAKLNPDHELYDADWHSLFNTQAALTWIADNPNANV
jgi:hypothetical protein